MSWADLFADVEDRNRIEWGLRSFSFAAAPDTVALLSGQRVDDWLRYGRVRHPQFQLTVPTGPGTHSAVSPAAFTQTRPYLAATMPGFPDVEAIAAQLAVGATLRLVNIEDFDQQFAALCARLTTLWNAPVTIDAFYPPPGDDGLGARFDDGDVFAIQVESSTIWELWDIPDGPDWPESQPLSLVDTPDHVLELAPGEGLYVPAGMGHRAFAGPDGSLHLSIRVKPTSYHDVVRAWTEEFLATVPLLDRLPLLGDRLPAITDILRGIGLAADKTDPAELLARVDRHRPKLSDAPLLPGVCPPRTDA
ncbi:MAG TPA: cupin domain-containing protein [Pseudonocardiaceae bacterium]|jgi:hypothetical protein